MSSGPTTTSNPTPRGIFAPSSLWLDQPDAEARIDAAFAAGTIDAGEAERLTFFARQGYVVFSLDVEPSVFDRLRDDVDRFWREKPADLAYAYDGPARRMRHADEARERRSRYRLHDVHSHSDAAKRLYLDPRIHRMVDLILDEPGVAIQSLAFEYGSQQLLHRDQVVVPTAAPGHLVAAWIALEDIHPDCGPLVYIPGSHRLPCFETAPGEYEYDGRRMGPEIVEAGLAWEAEQERQRGLEPEVFTPRKGEVLIWHAALRHGGDAVRNEALTRRSFVVHFSTKRTYPERSITIAEPAPAGDRHEIHATRSLVERGGYVGFENPILETSP